MSVNKSTWFGVCLKIKGYKFSEEIDREERFMQMNGSMGIVPEDGIFYLIPNARDTTRYGIYDVEYDEEKTIEVNSELTLQWSINFANDLFPIVEEYRLAYPELQIVIAFVSSFS